MGQGRKRERDEEQGSSKRRVAYDEDTLSEALRGFKSRLSTLLTSASHSRYTGGHVTLGGSRSPGPLTAGKKIEINRIGRTSGCHTCGGAPQDVWITDHIPPKELSAATLKRFWPKWDGKYRFYPHCNACAAKQSTLVNKLNKEKVARDLSKDEELLVRHHDLRKSIAGQKGAPTAGHRAEIQDFGDSDGCHSCSRKIASETFDADHVPPQEFGTGYMQLALELLKIRCPPWQVKPQCKRCSRNQGGDVKQLCAEIKAVMQGHGVTVYK